MIVEAMKGYEILLDEYRKVSVNDQTIGVASNGECLVWINRFLDKNQAESKALTSPIEIIMTILKNVKERSEPVCQKFLTKMEDYIDANK